jgi:hypothetical protein
VPRDALLVATVGELLWEDHQAKLAAKTSGDPWSPWHARDGWRMNLSAARTIGFRDGETLVEVQVRLPARSLGMTSMAKPRWRAAEAGWRPVCRRTRRPPPDRQRCCGRPTKGTSFCNGTDLDPASATIRCIWSKPAAPKAAA